MKTDYDGPWKRALRKFLPHAFRLLFPAAFDKIDWVRGFTFLDKELERAARDTRFPKLRVDKLVRVYLVGGGEMWLLIHIEVQNQHDAKFPLRMYVYNGRIFDRYGKPVASFGVLGDDSLSWRPDRFERNVLGTRVDMQFPIVKLKDFEGRIEELERDGNIFALVVAAHLRTKASHNDPHRRMEFKRHLLRLAYKCGHSKDDVRELLLVIDWLMALPHNLETQMESEWEALKMDADIDYIPHWERKANKEGLEEGMVKMARENVIDALRAHFGKVPAEVKKTVASIGDRKRLKSILKNAVTSTSLDEFKRALTK